MSAPGLQNTFTATFIATLLKTEEKKKKGHKVVSTRGEWINKLR